VLRFSRAHAMARVAPPAWADIAAACGFADQAHLTREFRALAGATPAAWAAARG
jgi:transcriptional regulator GlxA family with amidase domain